MREDLFLQLADKFEAGFFKTFPKILKFLVVEVTQLPRILCY